jgi:single-stranded-DNA-specific exonuclease
MVLAIPSTTGVSGRRWRLRGRFPDGALADLPHQALIRHLLWHRGFRDAPGAAAFMEAREPRHEISLIPDIEPAVARIKRAIANGELIAVYGDFDVDGVTASAILIEAISALGGKVSPYIPDRFAEGYGVNCRAIELLAERGVTLIITADCGTSSIEEIRLARELGMDTVIIDHHTVPPVLPAAVAVVNPKRIDSGYPESELSSGGLALRVVQLLHESCRRTLPVEQYLDLVALSTVCDMAPLHGENRWLVRAGLAAMAKAERPGLRALFEAAGCDPANVNAETIGYVLGPRLNAAGRLAHARHALDLMLEKDELKARALALQLCDLNAQRQKATSDAMELAKSLLSEEDIRRPLIFVGHEDIPSGIVGLVAGRLCEEHNRPAIVYERSEETSRARCRSIPDFDITGALRNLAPLMVRFGGHRAAAGFTAKNAALDALRDGLMQQSEETLAGVDLTPVIEVDAQIPLGRVNGELIRTLSEMAPFGVGNPEPVFVSRGLEVRDVRAMGEDGRHLRLQLRDGRTTWPAVAFGFGENQLQEGDRLDVVYTFSADRGGQGAMELRVLDFAPTPAG